VANWFDTDYYGAGEEAETNWFDADYFSDEPDDEPNWFDQDYYGDAAKPEVSWWDIPWGFKRQLGEMVEGTALLGGEAIRQGAAGASALYGAATGEPLAPDLEDQARQFREQIPPVSEWPRAAWEGTKDVAQEFWQDPKRFTVERPLDVLTTATLPFSAAAGGLKAAGQGAAALGRTAQAARLSRLGRTVQPGNLVREGLYRGQQAASRVPLKVGGTNLNPIPDPAVGVQETNIARDIYRSGLAEKRDTDTQVTGFLEHYEKLDDIDKGEFAENILLGRKFKGSTETGEAARQAWMGLTKKNEMRLVASYFRTHGKEKAEKLIETFDKAKPQYLERQLAGMGDQQKAAWIAEQGIDPGKAFYFPMQNLDDKVGIAGVLKSIAPLKPGAMKHRRFRLEDFNTNVPEVLARHQASINRFVNQRDLLNRHLTQYGSRIRVFDEAEDLAPGPPKMRAWNEIQQEVRDLEKKTGKKHVFVYPEGYLRFYEDDLTFQKAMLNALGEGDRDVAEVLQQLLPDEVNKRVAGHMRGVARTTQVYALPADLAKRMLTEMDRSMSAAGFVFDKVTDVWRAAILPLNPRWMAGNIVGSAGLSLLAGEGVAMRAGSLPGRIAKAAHASGKHPLEVGVGLARQAKAVEKLSERGMKQITLRGKNVGEAYVALSHTYPAEVAAKVVNVAYDWNNRFDDFFRQNVFYGRLAKQAGQELAEEGKWLRGKGADKLIEERALELLKDPSRYKPALDEMMYFMGNYMDLSPIERGVLRRVMPFWSWYKSMLKLATTMPVETPGRTLAVRGLTELLRDAHGQEDLPLELQGKVKMGKTDPETGRATYLDVGSLVPYQAVSTGPGYNPIIGGILNAQFGVTPWGTFVTPKGFERDTAGRVWRRRGNEMEQVDPRELTGPFALQQATQVARGLPAVRLAEHAIKGRRPSMADPLFSMDPAYVPYDFTRFTEQGLPEAGLEAMTGIGVRSLAERKAMSRFQQNQAKMLRRAMENAARKNAYRQSVLGR
jgi:hypothetical protein